MSKDVAAPGSTHSIVSPSSRLYNEDLAPASARERSWGTWSLFCMWMSSAHSIAGYTAAGSLFVLGLNGWQVFLALILGNLVILGGMTAMGFAGQRLGVPYPVFARLSFGIFGANIPALIRGIVAILWYGIQTYLASVALLVIMLKIAPGLSTLTKSDFLGLSTLGWISFLLMWVAQLLVLRRGMETVRKFIDFCGPAVWVVMLILAIWVVVKAGGNVSLDLPGEYELFGNNTLLAFIAAVSLAVSYTSAPILNFADFARFAPSRRAVMRGNLLGIVINSTAFSAVAVVVTSGTVAIYGKAIADPVELVAKFDNIYVLFFGAATFAVATVGINVVSNFVSPSYDLANVAPKHIDFKRGGLITAVLALLVMPWNLYSSPAVVVYFLGTLGAVLGPLFGVLVVDYYVIRKGAVSMNDLYQDDPGLAYYYTGGVNYGAVLSALVATMITVPMALVPALHMFSPFGWPVGVVIAGAIYFVVSRRTAADVRALLAEGRASDTVGGTETTVVHEPTNPRATDTTLD